MKVFDKNYYLTAEGIDELAEDFAQYLKVNETARLEALRLRLLIEELLLRVMDDRGAKAGGTSDVEEVTLRCQKKGNGHTILLKYGGEAFDPTVANTDESFDNEILQNLGFAPTWRYRRKVNYVQMRLVGKAGQSQLVLVLAAFLAGGIIGTPSGVRTIWEGSENVEKQEVWETYPGEGRAVGRSPARTPPAFAGWRLRLTALPELAYPRNYPKVVVL